MDWASEGAVALEATGYRCSRCDVECERWRWPDSPHEWYACPCCGCRIHSAEQVEASAQLRMAELGMNEDEYTDHCRSFIHTDPIPADDLEHARLFVMERAADWEPACEHDTQNPWAASPGTKEDTDG